MKVAIYVRYSSENQRPESIEDQIRGCQELATARGYSLDPTHIYRDEAKSGASRDRSGLEALLAAARARQFEAVLVDDLSRLSRDNHLLLTLYAEFRFNGVRIISRADSLDSNDLHSKLGFQMRGIVNELYLDDLREKTLRGQKGQKARGFVVGEGTYGYRSVPVGEMRVDRRGRPRPDGYKMVIDPSEAVVVQRIFTEFIEGKAITGIARSFNEEGIRGRRRSHSGWSAVSVGRILRNHKYIGRWMWNRTENRRDPVTGRLRKFPKPESEWHISLDDGLRIIPQDVWDRAVKRWAEIEQTWPRRLGKRGYEVRQRSYVQTHPTHLLSGSLRCGVCGGAIGQVSGKGAGYYGCLGAPRRACSNQLLVPRRLAERRLVAAVQEKLTPSGVHYVLERVEEEIHKLLGHLPEKIRFTKAALAEEERRVGNFIEFIGNGKGTPALAQALLSAEQKVIGFQNELRALEASAADVFKPPPVEWVVERLGKVREVLEGETAKSALLLRRILGPIRLLPVRPEVGRPYYKAETALQVLDLLEAPEGGSNLLQWWRRWASNPRPETLGNRHLHH
jgi:DNA invertase Pin-like site-specific DNA recombinase